MAISGWYTPETVVMMLNRWIWLPLIHIMKHKKATLFSCAYARPFTAACFVARSAPPRVPPLVLYTSTPEILHSQVWVG